jgi:O-antigen/teichoic acid export membrane protein
MSEKSSYSRGLAFSGLSFGVVFVIALLSSVAQSRVFGVRIFGEFALASAPMGALNYLSTVREQAGLTRALTALKARESMVAALFYAVLAFSFSLTLSVSLIVAVVTIIVFEGPLHHQALIWPAMGMLAGNVLFQNTDWNMDMLFAAFRAGSALFWVRLTQALTFLFSAVAGGLVWRNVWVLVLAYNLQWLAGFIHRLFLIGPYMTAVPAKGDMRRALREVPGFVKFGIKLAPGSIAGGMADQSATWTLGYFEPVAAVGAYNRAWQLTSRFTEGNLRVFEMLFPTLVERERRGDREGFDRVVIDSMRYTLAGWLLIAAAGGGAAIGVMRVFGSGFDASSTALVILLLFPAIGSIDSIATQVMTAHNRPWITTVISFVRLVVTVGAGIPLTSELGITGAAVALVFGYFVDMILSFTLMHRHLSKPLLHLWPLREWLTVFAAYGAGFAVARLIENALGTTYLATPVALLAGSVTFLAALILLGWFTERDRERLARLWSAITARKRLKGATAVAAGTAETAPAAPVELAAEVSAASVK